MRLQVSSARKREVAEATGTIGRPERRASVTMPSPARRAGPGGTSAVITTEAPPLRARAAWRKAVGAALVLAPRAGAGAADELDAEVGHGRADELRIAVARDHGRHLGPRARA